MYYYIFNRSRLIPRWLSGWGLIGIMMSIAAAVSFMFGVISSASPIHTALKLPVAAQEMVLAVGGKKPRT